MKHEHPRVLQVLVDDADGGDVFADARQPRGQAAHPPHNHLDPHTCLTRLVQQFSGGVIDQVVDLEDDPGSPACLRMFHLPLHQAHPPGAGVQWGDHKVSKLLGAVWTRKKLEHLFDFQRDVWMGGEEAEVRVNLRGAFVKVACANVCIAEDAPRLFSMNQAEFGVDFEGGDAELHTHAGFGHCLGPLDVGGFIEAGAQFHRCCHLLAVAGRADECVDHTGLAGHPVQRNVNGPDSGVDGRLVKPVGEVTKAVVRVIQQNVPAANGIECVAVDIELRRVQGRLGLAHQLASADGWKVNKILEVVVPSAWNHAVVGQQLQFSDEEMRHFCRHFFVVHKPHRRCV